MTAHAGVTGRKPAEQTLRPITVSIKVACELSGLSRSTIWRLATTGQIETTSIGRKRLIILNSLEALLRKSA